jgi:hypothetical protein
MAIKIAPAVAMRKFSICPSVLITRRQYGRAGVT